MGKKFTVIAVKWFDRANGNTYHSVRIIRHRDGKVIAVPFTYGYGSQYETSALRAMAAAKWLPPAYRHESHRNQDGTVNAGKTVYDYERENDYPIIWTVRDGTKRECMANGNL